jgi:plasmid stabilization system protein ParE
MKPIVVQEVNWTEEAKENFDSIIKWIESKWTAKEKDNFIAVVEKKIAILEQFPTSCRISNKRKNVRISVLDKHNKIVYHYHAKQQKITILAIWIMKQDPQKFKY